MTPVRVAIVALLVVVASSIAVGAATPSQTATPDEVDEMAMPLGAQLSSVMQANAGQARGVVENGMWEAAFADASDESAQRALVDRRAAVLNGSMAELAAERRALREAYRNGSIDRAEYEIRMAAVVGQLAAVGDGIEETSERARAVGVNTTRLDALRSQARELGGAEVSRMARNLTGNGAPPGQSGVFGDERPGQSGQGGPPDGMGRGGSTGQSDGPGPPDGPPRGQSTETPTATDN